MEKIPKSGSITRYSEDSYDEFSVNYARTREDIARFCWYDEYPYSLGIWPGSFADIFRKNSWFIRRVNYPFVAVEMVLEGCVTFEQHNREFVLQEGDIFITCPREQLLLTDCQQQKVRMLQLIIYGNFGGMIAEMLNFKGSGILHPENPAVFEQTYYPDHRQPYLRHGIITWTSAQDKPVKSPVIFPYECSGCQ